MKNFLPLLCFSLGIWCGSAADTFDHSHARLDKILKTHVQNGLVDYAALKANPSELNDYLDEQGGNTVAQFAAPYFNDPVAAELNKGGYRISFTDYDWSLNDLKNRPKS